MTLTEATDTNRTAEYWRDLYAASQVDLEQLRAELRHAHGASQRKIKPAWTGAMHHVRELDAALAAAYQQLRYLWEHTGSCPCGARRESPQTHPHVGGCPTAKATNGVTT